MEYNKDVKEYMKTLPQMLQTAIVESDAKIDTVEQLKALAEAYEGQ